LATISNTPRPGYVWDSTDNVWYPIGVGAHQHTNAADTPAVMPYSTYAAAGKNKILNGDFAINQRGFTTTTTSGTYGFDRFNYIYGDGTATYSAQTFTAGTAPVSGYEAANFARVVTASQTAAGAYTIIQNRIEDVRTLAGQTATISFWAKAASGTPKIAIELEQVFGSGGSPSTTTQTYFAQTTLSTSWARYSVTMAIPSLSGKTVGTTANTSYLIWNLWTSAGTTYGSRTGSLGIQNATIDIWGIQLEAGSNATAFALATGTPATELAACQRYYVRLNSGNTGIASTFGMGYAGSATAAQIFIPLPVPMRRKGNDYLTLEYSSVRMQDYNNPYTVTAIGIPNYQSAGNGQVVVVTSSGMTTYRPMELDTTNGGYIAFGAEL
jgi:hypothetical protein